MFERLMPLNPRYYEIIRLHDMLTAVNVPHTFERLFDGWHLEYPCSIWEGERVCSAIEHRGSFGHEDDKLEIMGLLTDEEREDYTVVGWLTADDVYLRICQHYACTSQEANCVEKESQ